MAYCILVAGMPASGKSTLAKFLSRELGLPMVSKDDIKEKLYDAVGFESRAEKVQLGLAAADILRYFAAAQMRVGQPFILEDNFENATKPAMAQLLQKYNYRAITLRLGGEMDEMYRRFVQRDTAPERHRGHVVNDVYPNPDPDGMSLPRRIMTLEEFAASVHARGMDEFCLGERLLFVDTTHIEALDMQGVAKKLRECIRGLSML